MNFIRILLLPISWIYSIILFVRHKFYDWGILNSTAFDIPIIVIGNLELGGTGKTPMTEYLIRQLSNEFKVAILSRGYKRRTSGFRIADDSDTSYTIGDEPMQFYQGFKEKVIVAVHANRSEGVRQILHRNPETELIILDDAIQHRGIKPGFIIQLTPYEKPYYENRLIPSGTLRDLKIRSHKSDILIMSKCPDSVKLSQQELKDESQFQGNIYFSRTAYSSPVSIHENNGEIQLEKCIAVCGIADPSAFLKHCNSLGIKKSQIHSDHRLYTRSDILKLRKTMGTERFQVLTTHKDAVRFGALDQRILEGISVFYVPIETVLFERETAFLEEIQTYLNRH